MDRELLRQYLSFYRDLGVKTLYLPEGVSAAAVAPTIAEAPAVASPAPPISRPAPPPPVSRPVLEPVISRPAPAPAAIPEPPPMPRPAAPSGANLFPQAPDNDTLALIRADLKDCRRCRLCDGRHSIVFGSGNENSRLVFVGEGPGADEDEQGLPFVGRAGQLLTMMIDNTSSKEGFAIRRDDVYICNVVKCRPPGNRAPEPDEMEICGQFLARQLSVLKPRAICALGGTATKALLGAKEGITKLRGRWHHWRDIPVMPTYHPSYLLRPTSGKEAKREAWEDLKKVLHYVYDDPPRPLSDF